MHRDYFVQYRVWSTSPLVILTTAYFNTPSVGKSPKNKGPDFPGFAETDRTVAARSSRLHHDIRTLSCILASRVITCEGMHCMAGCLGSAVRACGGRGGGHHALLGALCSRSLAAVRLPYPPGVGWVWERGGSWWSDLNGRWV